MPFIFLMKMDVWFINGKFLASNRATVTCFQAATFSSVANLWWKPR
jgi:hypothetical protein